MFTIPLDKITAIKKEIADYWVKIKLEFTRHKEKFFGGKKEVTERKYFTFSRIYEDVVDFLIERVDESGGNVEIVEVEKV